MSTAGRTMVRENCQGLGNTGRRYLVKQEATALLQSKPFGSKPIKDC